MIRKLLGKGAFSLAIKVVAGALAFGMAAAMAEALVAVEYGKFASGLSIALFLGQFASLGQPKLVLRFLGKYAAPDAHAVARGVIRYSRRQVMIAAGLTGGGVLLVTLATVGDGNFAAHAHWIALAPLICGLALAEYYSHLLRAFKTIGWALMPRDVLWRASVLAMGGLLIWTGVPVQASGVLGCAAVVLAVLVALQAHHAHVLARAIYGTGPCTEERDSWRSAGWGLWGLNILSVSFPLVSVFLLGLLLNYVEAGVFFGIVRIVGLLAMPLLAINLVVAPDIATDHHKGDLARVQDICRSSMIILLPILLGSAAMVVIFRKLLLGLFGPPTPQAELALCIMTVGYVLNSLSGSTGLLMQMTGHERRFLAFSAAANGVALALFFVVVPVFGIVGAAVCVVLSSSGWNVPVALWCRRRLGVDPSALVLLLGRPLLPERPAP